VAEFWTLVTEEETIPNDTTKRKIAIVTGGSRGLGRDMALRLAEQGIDVILTYHTKKQEAPQLMAKLVHQFGLFPDVINDGRAKVL